MHISRDLANRKNAKRSSVLTIGNFDGFHRGHQAVLNRVKEVAKESKEAVSVLTFENHPSEILRPNNKIQQIYTVPHKIKLFSEYGVDELILLPFTNELSKYSAEEFLTKVYEHQPFSHLILGHDATLGKDKKGDKKALQTTAKNMNFSIEHLEPYVFAGKVVSSSEIRTLIQNGQLPQTETLLGRKYSVYGPVIAGISKAKSIGFPTANIDVSPLCVPTYGVYAVRVICNGKTFDAIANLGVAPTVRVDQKPLLEVHLLDEQVELYGQMIEVVFYDYIRGERKFAGLEELSTQIRLDIVTARRILSL